MHSSRSPSAKPQQVQATTQLGAGSHPLSHVLDSEATVQSMGYVSQVGEAFDQGTTSTSAVYTTDGYQDSAGSQAFTSPVYNTQTVTQVYQIPLQSQSALSSEHFPAHSETFSSAATNTSNYVPSSQQQQQQQGIEIAASQQGQGGSELRGMDVQSQETNVLHMQAQITQSAYELQSVQMQPSVMPSSSMQTYDGSGMMGPSANFQDGSAGMYQEGINAYETGTSTLQFPDGYQDPTQTAAHSQTISSLGTSFSGADNLGGVEASRQMYSTSAVSAHGEGFVKQEHQQMSFNATGSAATTVAYNPQVAATSEAAVLLQPAADMYSSDAFQQPAMGSGDGGTTLQSQPQITTETNTLLGEQQQADSLPTVTQVETVVTQSKTGDQPADKTSTENGGTSEKTTAKKSQRPKASIGTQCELGPETFRALKESQAKSASSAATVGSGSSHEDTVLNTTPMAVSSSVLLSSSDAPPLQDPLGVSSPPGVSEIAFTGQSDKIIRKYPCEVSTCTKAYVHRKDLIRHMTLRHGMSPQKLEPVVIETPEKPYTCQVGACRKSYFHQKDLRRHQRQCHSVPDNSTLLGAVEMTDANGKVMVRFPCDFPGCQRSYVHKKDLVRHKRVYHKDESKKPSIPVPVKFTEADLKRIRHEERAFQEKETPDGKKPRLDSTGSMMSGGEDQNTQFTEMTAMQISEAMEMSQLSTASPASGAGLDQSQVSYETLSSTVAQDIAAEEEQNHLTTAQLALGLAQQQQQQQQQQGSQQAAGVHLPTILRRQRQGSNGQFTTPTAPTTQEQQQQMNELALRNLASLMLGGLQGNSGSGGAPFDITQQAVTAFSAPSPVTSTDAAQSTTDTQQAAIAQFDPAAIISALSNVVNNPEMLQAAASTPPSLEQQQVVSMENVANTLQYLTSTSNSTQ